MSTHRPAEFDALILRYLPGLRKLAARLRPMSPKDERDELVQATILKAIENWRKYRPGVTPFPWLKLLMRGINRDELGRAAALKRTVSHMFASIPRPAALPNQEHMAGLSLLVDQITPAMLPDMLAIGQGIPCAHLAPTRGITKQRMDQMVRVERERLASLERRADTRRALAYGRAA